VTTVTLHGRPLRWAEILLMGLAAACPLIARAQSEPATVTPPTATSSTAQLPEADLPGSITGTVVDPKGAPVAGAKLTLTREGKSLAPEVMTGDDGQYTFANIMPGPFTVTVSGEGFATQTASGVLQTKESFQVPPVALAVATAVTEVRVELSTFEIAQEQLKEQEKQRVLGLIPNFYVTYDPHPVPLTTKLKLPVPATGRYGTSGASCGTRPRQSAS